MSALFGPILRPRAFERECVETYDDTDPHAVPAVASDPVTWAELEDPVFRKGPAGKCYNASTIRDVMDRNNLDPMTREAYDADDRMQVIVATDRDLFAAIQQGYPAIVMHLVSTGASVSERNEIGQTPLFAAALATECTVRRVTAWEGERGVAMMVLNQGMLASRAEHEPGLRAALERGHADQTEMLTILLTHGASVNDMCADSTESRSALHVVARSFDNIGAVRCLIEHGADVRSVDTEGDTPLHSAAKRDFAAMVEALIAAGAEVGAKNSEGRTAFACAFWTDHARLCNSARLLLSHVADVDKFKALKTVRSVAKFRAMVERGAPLHMEGAMSALTRAIERGDADIVQFIIKGDQLSDAKDWRWADLTREFQNDMRSEVAEAIIQRFEKFTHHIPHWQNAFYFALRSGSVEAMEKIMVLRLENLQVHDDLLKTVSEGLFDNLLMDSQLRDDAWEAAIQGGHLDAASRMFDYIRCINGTTRYDGEQWMSFMFAAVRSGDTNMLDMVMEKKQPRKQVDFSWRDSLGETILMNAVGDDHLHMLEHLVEISKQQRTNKLESTINCQSHDNETALTFFVHDFKVEHQRSMHAGNNHRQRMALLHILLSMGPSPEVLRQAAAVARNEEKDEIFDDESLL